MTAQTSATALSVAFIALAATGCSQSEDPIEEVRRNREQRIEQVRQHNEGIAEIERQFAQEHDALAGWESQVSGPIFAAEAHRLLVEPNRRIVWRGLLKDVLVEGVGYRIVLDDPRPGTSSDLLFSLRCSRALGERLLESHREQIEKAQEKTSFSFRREEIVLAAVQPTAIRRPFSTFVDVDEGNPSLYLGHYNYLLVIEGELVDFRIEMGLVEQAF